MARLDRYLLRECVSFFLLALGVTTAILLLDKLPWLVSLTLRHRLSFSTFLRFLGYILLTLSSLSVPIAFLIGGTLTFNRLALDNEYTALQAAGVSFYRLIAPLLALACLLYVVVGLLQMYAAPWGFRMIRQLFFEVAQRRALFHLRPQEFNDTFKGLVLYVERISPEQRLEGVFIADLRTPVPRILTARTGAILRHTSAQQVILRLEHGVMHHYLPTQKRYQLFHFRRYDIVLELDTRLGQHIGRAPRPRELFPTQLLQVIRQRQVQRKPYLRYVLFWHRGFALPFACLIFAGLGPALGVVPPRLGRSGGYVIS
ncbi:LptF/LptG family permease, partial [Candidatus Parcubacteria bacterium]